MDGQFIFSPTAFLALVAAEYLNRLFHAIDFVIFTTPGILSLVKLLEDICLSPRVLVQLPAHLRLVGVPAEAKETRPVGENALVAVRVK